MRRVGQVSKVRRRRDAYDIRCAPPVPFLRAGHARPGYIMLPPVDREARVAVAPPPARRS